MPLKVGPAAANDAEDCEIFGGEFPDVDIDTQNQQNLYFSQQNIVQKVSQAHTGNAGSAHREIMNEPINF